MKMKLLLTTLALMSTLFATENQYIAEVYNETINEYTYQQVTLEYEDSNEIQYRTFNYDTEEETIITVDKFSNSN